MEMKMDTMYVLLIIDVVVHGYIAGISFDTALVKLPARKRIGNVAYARFARGNDLGNGLIVYPAFGILTILLALGTMLLGFFSSQPTNLLTPLTIAVLLTIGHSLSTAKAAPVMISLRDTPDEESVLAAKLDRFAFWNAFRTLFQSGTFLVFLWALVVHCQTTNISI
jgi:hypothetical protein